VGARSHCDVVVKVDEARAQILAIGGNVRGAVTLKVLRGNHEAGTPSRLLDMDEDARPIFAHLKLRADPVAANALDTSPTMKAFGCLAGTRAVPLLAAAGVAVASGIAARC
jgi:hypothetical protein